MLGGLGIDPKGLPAQYDRSHWRKTAETFAAILRARPLEEWEKVFADRDACFTTVVRPDAVREHPQNAARASFVEQFGLVQPQAAPRFSRTAVTASATPCHAGEHTVETLRGWGFEDAELDGLAAAGAIRQVG
jgi:alpha-methylacyl-CoA racemase